MEKIIITPKNKSSIGFLKKLFEELDSIKTIEVIKEDEVTDHRLLKQMKKNRRGGLTTYNSVMKTLDKIISK